MTKGRGEVWSDRKRAVSIDYFSYADQVRRWLEERHAIETEILVGFCN
jgi:hypothetical protein